MSGNLQDRKSKPIIFVAEDVPRNLQVLCNMLVKENYKIAAAGDGRQALEMIPVVNPDLILLDIMMPEMNGFEVCNQLKENPQTADIPVIFLTAKAETEDVVTGFELGAVDYITKPFNGAELLSRIKNHLELKFAREELKELNATKDKFFSIIAHDLKNPLQNSILYSDTLKEYYDSFDHPKRKEYIDKFCKSTQQITELLENLLQWARSQKGVIQPNPERVSLHAVASENFRLLVENAEKKSITLVNSVDPDLIAWVDRNMLVTVIRNLISNAVKFTRPQGTVTLSSVPAKDGRVSISVADNGVGIKDEDIRGLFRLDVPKTTLGTAKEKGTGLGLILCKEFIEKNNGTITVASDLGHGATFTVTLPAA